MEQKATGLNLTLGNGALILAGVSALVVLIPVLFGCWSDFLMWVHIISGIGALTCALMAYWKGQETKKVVITLVVTLFTFVIPSCMHAEHTQAEIVKAQKAAEKAAHKASNPFFL
jgi:hypothetical protein